ncbi:hypothetical protein AC623_19920 [Bacillus sp. FJAT-27231]|uniref:HD-GYP domain-containing protein n=1 Tax=Bacillus sp. FJAT-27231 TaxID=1679168 RepID=UPI000670D795|nr:HD domain-containing phosphohydrolase [Bacillus sp. FJAT-27231]KMY55924.1 hypothetical protein AC623_19920 [Bacillus sp. FJAT-27231]
MYVKVENLKEGHILLDDVIGKSPVPLMEKETALTNWHIKILEAFLVNEVAIVEGQLSEVVAKTETSEEKKSNKITPVPSQRTDFFQHYLQSVEEHKKEFQKWQAGSGVDIVKIREMILPLLDKAIDNPDVFWKISNYVEKGNYISHHSISTGLLSGMIAMQLDYEKGMVVQSALAGTLADCGMARINPRILLKETSLTAGERKEVDNHPFLSYKMVKDIKLLKQEAKLAVFQHHERLDGSGYVNGVKAEKLLLISRIVALADVFHAMTAERPYRDRQLIFKVLEMFRQDFFGQFDLSAVKALTNLFTKLPSGTTVQLSDGQIATILFMKQQQPTRPLLQLQKDDTILDLEKRRDLYIEKIL